MSSVISRARLMAERKAWRKDHPHAFYARPMRNDDGSLDLMKWKCGIPGKAETLWEGATYTLWLEFPPEYPDKPPKCRFEAGFFHPNVYPSGTVCLSLVDEEKDWKPSITVKQILLGIQDLLANPNLQSPAQEPAYASLKKDKREYMRKVREYIKTVQAKAE